jgi:hypothetical protein
MDSVHGSWTMAALVHGGPRIGPQRWLTGAWMMGTRWHNGGGALAQTGGGASVIEDRRRRVGGVGCSIGVWASFNKAGREAEMAGIGGRRQ